MKNLIILLLAFIASNAFGQEIPLENGNSNHKRFQIGLSFSPDICYRTLVNGGNDNDVDYIIQNRNEREIVKFGYTTGLNVYYFLKHNFGLEAGIQYANRGYQTKSKELIFENPGPSDPQKSIFIYNFRFIDIPFKATYSLGQKRTRFFVGLGLITNVFIKEEVTNILEYEGGRVERNTQQSTYDYNKMNLSLSASAGLDFRLNSRMHLRFEPVFRHNAFKIIKSDLKGYLWSAGLNVSCYTGF